jgi:hypothetical protein
LSKAGSHDPSYRHVNEFVSLWREFFQKMEKGVAAPVVTAEMQEEFLKLEARISMRKQVLTGMLPEEFGMGDDVMKVIIECPTLETLQSESPIKINSIADQDQLDQGPVARSLHRDEQDAGPAQGTKGRRSQEGEILEDLRPVRCRSRMRAFIGKALKSLALCAAVYLLLLGLSVVVTAVSQTLTKDPRVYTFENIWYVKFPLFALVTYLVFSKRL